MVDSCELRLRKAEIEMNDGKVESEQILPQAYNPFT
jgi:hypothetical protein